MRSLSSLFLVALVGGSLLSDVYGNVSEVKSMLPFYKRRQTRTFGAMPRKDGFFDQRRADNCNFPIDVVILQDLTASFTDDLSNMVQTQLKLMMEGLVMQHPNTRVGVVTFRDKPIWSLGESFTDYCVKFELPFTQNVTQLIDKYRDFISTGGGDPPECQFTALNAVAQSRALGWDETSTAARLAVVVTDAQPHFEGDGFNSYGLPQYPGVFDEENSDAQCLEYYYPSPDQVKIYLAAKEIYAGFLVYGGSYEAGLPRDSWQWFNSYIGQSAHFFQDLESDSSNFWAKLSKILSTLEDAECSGLATLTPEGTVEDVPETFETLSRLVETIPSVPEESTQVITPSLQSESSATDFSAVSAFTVSQPFVTGQSAPESLTVPGTIASLATKTATTSSLPLSGSVASEVTESAVVRDSEAGETPSEVPLVLLTNDSTQSRSLSDSETSETVLPSEEVIQTLSVVPPVASQETTEAGDVSDGEASQTEFPTEQLIRTLATDTSPSESTLVITESAASVKLSTPAGVSITAVQPSVESYSSSGSIASDDSIASPMTASQSNLLTPASMVPSIGSFPSVGASDHTPQASVPLVPSTGSGVAASELTTDEATTDSCPPCPEIGPCEPCGNPCWPCNPMGPCDICDINDGLLLKLRHRPKVFRFEIQN